MECCVQQLPEFPPPEGERRPMSFRRVLLNTCQEEFEGAAAAREVRHHILHGDIFSRVQHCCCGLIWFDNEVTWFQLSAAEM